MTDRWFRFYDGVLNDPKAQRLAPSLFKTWINLLCLASQVRENGVLPITDDIAFALRMDPEQCRRDLDALIKAGLIETDAATGHDAIHNWRERQYNKPSDTPERVSERVSKHRAKKQDGVSEINEQEQCNAPVTPSNASVTPTIREETEKIREDSLTGDAPAEEAVTTRKPSPKKWSASDTPHRAVQLFHDQRTTAVGKAPTRKQDEETQAARLWEDDEAAYCRALVGYFGCLNGSDDWPKRQGFTFIAFLRQFDKWEAGKPPTNAPARAAPVGSPVPLTDAYAHLRNKPAARPEAV